MSTRAKIEAFANSMTTVDVPLRALPMLLWLRQIDDPKTIERVDPTNLATSVGPNVRITRAAASITHENVTAGPERYLKPAVLRGLDAFD